MNRKHIIKMINIILGSLLCVSMMVTPAMAYGDTQYAYTSQFTEDEDNDYVSEYQRKQKQQTATTLFVLLLMAIVVVPVICFMPKKKKEEQLFSMDVKDDAILRMIQEANPHFAPDDFKQYVRDRLLQLQKAFEQRDLNTLHLIETETLYFNHRNRIEQMNNIVPFTEFQMVKGVALESFHRNIGYDLITVVVYLNLIEYTMNMDNKQVVQGSRSESIDRTYRMEFLRASDDYIIGLENCPNCGAPMELDLQGRCMYCHTPMLHKKLDWLINSYDIC